MHPDLTAALAAEHHRDLLAAADRRRLAAAAAPPAALRLRLGRRLVSFGLRISGQSGVIGHPSDCS
ncbi:MAG: hypothetical protein ACRDKB_00795 [Actinomycetota bacterium]